MIVKNAYVFTEECRFEKKDICIQGDLFAEMTKDREVIDGSGCFAVPGLTDIHLHGCAGYDFSDGTQEAIRAMAAHEASVGVAVMVPAAMTLSEERLMKICKTAAQYRKEQALGYDSKQALLWGIHLEGPFIAGGKRGAQNPAYIREPDIELFRRLNRAAEGCIRLTGLAPERKGAMDFIEELHTEYSTV